MKADIVACLVSPDFIASEFCFSNELPRALTRRKAGVTVVPIVVRPCEWDQTPLAKLQVMPLDSDHSLLAITQWHDQDSAWLEVSRQFRQLIQMRSP